jgi:Domain of unknown function (DUF1844)
MNDSTERFGGGPDEAELDQAEAMRQLQHDLATAPPIEVVAQAVAHLATLAYVRLGVPPQENERYRDLEAARVLIDALGGLLGAVEGRLGPGADELHQALAALRITYAGVSGQQGTPAAPGERPGPARPQEPAEPRPRRPSGLWVPGQD